MAHIQQQEFCKRVRDKFPDFFKNKFVLDIGSLDINGNNQEWFENCKYLGVDIAYGRNVDIVSKGHELGFPDNTFDIIISTECFEHDQYYDATIKNIYRMLKPGGLFLFTCATTGRAEHGTRRTTPEDAPLLQSDIEWSDYYKNLTEDDIREVLNIESDFEKFQFAKNDISNDLYFYGFKIGEYIEHINYSFLLKNSPAQLLQLFSQLFLDFGDGISEENSIKLPVAQNTEIQEFVFDLSDQPALINLQLDPLNDSCVIQIEKCVLVTDDSEIDLVPFIQANDCVHHAKNYFFETINPQISFEGLNGETFQGSRKFVIHIRYIHIAREAVHVCAKQLVSDREYQNNLSK